MAQRLESRKVKLLILGNGTAVVPDQGFSRVAYILAACRAAFFASTARRSPPSVTAGVRTCTYG